jgi:hypothetical protein
MFCVYLVYAEHNCTSLNTGPVKTFFLTKPQYLIITSYKKSNKIDIGAQKMLTLVYL